MHTPFPVLRFVFIGAFIGFTSLSNAADVQSIDSPAGQLSVMRGDYAIVKGKYTVSMRLTHVRDTARQAPVAMIGFVNGSDLSDGIQFFLGKVSSDAPELITGYQVKNKGRVVEQKAFASGLAADHLATFKIDVDNGTFSVQTESGKSQTITTHLRSVRPYIGVSSGVGEFQGIDALLGPPAR